MNICVIHSFWSDHACTGITQGFRVIPEVTPKWVNNTNVHSKFTLISLFSNIHSLKSEHIHSFLFRDVKVWPWHIHWASKETSERHTLKSKARTWIIIGHRLAIILLTKHIYIKRHVCVSQKRTKRMKSQEVICQKSPKLLASRARSSERTIVRRLHNPPLKLNE